jgi:hypothetical protein
MSYNDIFAFQRGAYPLRTNSKRPTVLTVHGDFYHKGCSFFGVMMAQQPLGLIHSRIFFIEIEEVFPWMTMLSAPITELITSQTR